MKPYTIFSQRIAVVAFSLLFATTACKSTREANHVKEPVAEAVNSEMEEGDKNGEKSPEIRYRFIVSLISIGEGTDLKAGSDLMNYLAEYKKNTGIELSYTPVPWGREGEADLCFVLNELDEAAQAQFVSEVRERIGMSALVQFAENETCSHKR